MRRSRFEELGDRIETPIPRDSDGYIDRECPVESCLKQFKVLPGTGLQHPAPCICPYCGHSGPSDEFATVEQVEFASQNAFAVVQTAFQDMLRNTVRGSKCMTLKTSPVRHPTYRHKELETKLVCPSCDLHYAIYGKFAYCPDCGEHNSRQMLEITLDIVRRQLDFAEAAPTSDLRTNLIENSLEDAVSAFDGYGREVVRVKAEALGDPKKVEGFSFQNFAAAEKRLAKSFGPSFSLLFQGDDFEFASRMALQRHLIAHKLGVIDAEYVAKSGDPSAIVGRKLVVDPEDIIRLAGILGYVAQGLEAAL